MTEPIFDFVHLRNDRTIGGLPIVAPLEDEENWLRLALWKLNQSFRYYSAEDHQAQKQRRMTELVEASFCAWAQLETRYGQARLHHPFVGSLVPLTRWSPHDLLRYGFKGLLDAERTARIASASDFEISCAIGILIVHQAAEYLKNGRIAYAAHLLSQATSCCETCRAIYSDTYRAKQTKSQLLRGHLRDRARHAGSLSGEKRTRQAAAQHLEIRSAAARLRSLGVNERDLASRLATKFGKTSDHIRRVLKKTT